MKSKRLKLYNSTLKLKINNVDKEKLRKIAFSKNMTMSDYTRNLIKIIIELNSSIEQKKKILTSEEKLNTLITLLGGEKD